MCGPNFDVALSESGLALHVCRMHHLGSGDDSRAAQGAEPTAHGAQGHVPPLSRPVPPPVRMHPRPHLTVARTGPPPPSLAAQRPCSLTFGFRSLVRPRPSPTPTNPVVDTPSSSVTLFSSSSVSSPGHFVSTRLYISPFASRSPLAPPPALGPDCPHPLTPPGSWRIVTCAQHWVTCRTVLHRQVASPSRLSTHTEHFKTSSRSGTCLLRGERTPFLISRPSALDLAG